MSELGLNKPPVAPHTSQLALFESKCPWYLKVKPQHRTQQSIVRSHQELNVNKKLTKDDVLGRPGSWRAPGGHRASLITSPWYHHRHNCQSLSKLRSHPGQNASRCVQLLIFHWRINYFFFSLRECPEHPSVMPSKHCLSKIIRKKYLRQHSSKARHWHYSDVEIFVAIAR